MRALKVCPCTGCEAHERSCPNLVPQGRCTRCSRTADRARGTRHQRGYDAEHYRLRKQWEPKVRAGGVHCHAKVCLMPARLMIAGQPWDLGHSEDRTTWTGPEHQRCNRSAGGKAAHAQ